MRRNTEHSPLPDVRIASADAPCLPEGFKTLARLLARQVTREQQDQTEKDDV